MSLTRQARTYIAAIVSAGALAIAWSIGELWQAPPRDRYWLVLLGLTCFSSTFSIRIPQVAASISVSETFVFLCALLYGAPAATLVVAVDGLLISYWRRWRFPQVLFNGAAPALALFVAARVFVAVGGHDVSHPYKSTGVLQELVPLTAFTLSYFLANSGMMAGIASLVQRRSVWSIWRSHFGTVLLTYCGSASMAALLVYNSRTFSFTTIAIVVPLLLISYFTFKTSWQRVEDATRHLDEMNRLYLSTIETLATAVDATDQITHGHIRRVQTWAVGLAKALGVSEPDQMKAIEAAALLHDVGKLAIPEHILNKPGKLTQAEFESIKKHASIGADILSAVNFPYPVVPIVRHHHENWDGTGYPDGLSGADIPIGARILAVVDCFDALTSDRPYRRALSNERAIEMLQEERGRHYDPLVVDTFVRVFTEIAPVEAGAAPNGETLREIAEVSQSVPAAAPSADGDLLATDMVPIGEVILAGLTRPSWHELGDEIADRLRRLTPAALVVFFVHDDATAKLVVGHASGEHADLITQARLDLGERLSGWVGAARRTIVNSDGALDFVGLDGPMPALRSCLSVPLIAGDVLEGVLTLYAREAGAFTDAHRASVETAARPLAHLLRTLRSLKEVERLTMPSLTASMRFEGGSAVPSDDKSAFTTVFSVPLQLAGPPAERHLALVRSGVLARRAVGDAGRVYLDGDSSLLVLVTSDDTRTTATLAARLRERLTERRMALGVASSPADGRDAASLVQLARRRAQLTLCPPFSTEGRGDKSTATRQQPLFEPAQSRGRAADHAAGQPSHVDGGPAELNDEASTG
jgi:putative nucleotidyltransferase with HDIG domain